MNPFVTTWLAVDLIAVIPLLRLLRAGPSARTFAVAMAGLQLVALASAIGSTRLDVAGASPLIWTTIVAANVALAVAGLTVGLRVLALIGLVATAGAVVLVLLGSFGSIAVAACAAIVLMGGALLPRSAKARTAG